MNPHHLCSPAKGLFCIIINKYRLLFTFFVTHPIHGWTEETNTLWISVISNQQVWHLQSDLSLWMSGSTGCECALLCLEPTPVECYRRTQTWGLSFLFARRLSSSTEAVFCRFGEVQYIVLRCFSSPSWLPSDCYSSFNGVWIACFEHYARAVSILQTLL